MSQAKDITSKAKSNLAFALIDLPEEKRRHMAEFYAFCRIVDDLVDEPGYTDQERSAALDRWESVVKGNAEYLNELEQDIANLINSLKLDIEPMLQIIEGCRSDIHQQQPRTREELLNYSYRVASCVGLTCLPILGASPKAEPYAIALGHALQIVNIIRDIAEDFAKHNRIYLPEEDMRHFQYTVEDLGNSVYSDKLRNLLNHEAAWGDQFFREAESVYASLSKKDKNSLVPAQAMALIYKTILEKMKTDGFHVFAKRYRVNTFHKLWLLFRARLGIN